MVVLLILSSLASPCHFVFLCGSRSHFHAFSYMTPFQGHVSTSATTNGEPDPAQKSHRMDDVEALKALMARRKSTKPSGTPSGSHHSNPRLPVWAKEAVASQGRQNRIATPSEPTRSPSTSTPRPFPKSPFT